MRRLVAAGLLPERAGQPVKVWAHVSLAELRALDDGSVLAQEWVGEMAVRWAARRAAASQAGSDGAAWLDGKPARAMACDASVIPVVTGGIDPAALDDLVSLCLQLRRPRPALRRRPDAAGPSSPARRQARLVRLTRPRARTLLTGQASPAAPALAGPDPGQPADPQPRTRPVSQARPRAQGRRRPARTRSAAADRPGPGDAPARDHRPGRRPGLRPRRAGQLPADPAAGRPAGRALPAAGRRAQRRDPRRHPPRGHPARPALPLGRQDRSVQARNSGQRGHRVARRPPGPFWSPWLRKRACGGYRMQRPATRLAWPGPRLAKSITLAMISAPSSSMKSTRR